MRGRTPNASGYTVADVFEDDDITAYKGKVNRPGYISMLSGLREGRFDVVMATDEIDECRRGRMYP